MLNLNIFSVFTRLRTILVITFIGLLAACADQSVSQVEIPDRPLTTQDRTADGEPVYARMNLGSEDNCMIGGHVFRVQAMVDRSTGQVVDQGDYMFTDSTCAAIRTAAASGLGGAAIATGGKMIKTSDGDFIVQAMSGSSAQSDAEASVDKK